jgi:hypothetical protein
MGVEITVVVKGKAEASPPPLRLVSTPAATSSTGI